MLLSPNKHKKSVSCATLRKYIIQEHSQLPDKNQFVPFCSERKLGKLITRGKPATSLSLNNQQLLNKINFQNFHKIYQTVLKFQNEKYSEMTRKSGQKNLINNEWRVNSLNKNYMHQQINRDRASHKEDKHQLKSSKQLNQPRSNSHFQKMNEYLFKKMSKVPEPGNNPELQQIYSNYLQICEINENIHRQQLLGHKLKY